MAWTSLTFSFGSLLTSTKMTQLQDNFAAMAAGDSGAPTVDTAGITALAVTTAKIAALNVTGATIAASTITAAKVSWGSSSASGTGPALIVMTANSLFPDIRSTANGLEGYTSGAGSATTPRFKLGGAFGYNVYWRYMA